MKSGPFIKLVADVLGLEVGNVKVVARLLREAGFLTTGARGVNAPHMTAQDASRLIIAIMTGAPPSRVVDEFRVFRVLELQADRPPSAEALAALLGAGDAQMAEDYLTLVVQKLVDDRDFYAVETDLGIGSTIEFTINDQSHTAVLEIGEHSASFSDFERLRKSADLKEAKGGPENWTQEDLDSATWKWRGIQTSRTITAMELIRIADGLAGRRIHGTISPVMFAGGVLDA